MHPHFDFYYHFTPQVHPLDITELMWTSLFLVGAAKDPSCLGVSTFRKNYLSFEQLAELQGILFAVEIPSGWGDTGVPHSRQEKTTKRSAAFSAEQFTSCN